MKLFRQYGMNELQNLFVHVCNVWNGLLFMMSQAVGTWQCCCRVSLEVDYVTVNYSEEHVSLKVFQTALLFCPLMCLCQQWTVEDSPVVDYARLVL